MFILRNGWINGIRHCLSPNFNERPSESDIRLLVIHCISLPEGEYENDNVEAFFCNGLDTNQHPSLASLKGVEVSAHFYIRRSGEVIQCVATDKRAWHAGKSRYLGVGNCNDFSIGIELQGCIAEGYTDAQYQGLIVLTKTLQAHYPKIGAHIVAHSDIAPERKQDPGPYFDWQFYLSQLTQEGV